MNTQQGTEIQQRGKHSSNGLPWYTPWVHWRFRRFWLLVALLAYTLAGFFLAPWLLERTAVRTVADLGRNLQIGEIRMNPWTLTTEITDLAMRDTDDQEMLRFQRLFLNLQTSSLFRWAWTLKELDIHQLVLSEERLQPVETRYLRLLRDLDQQQAPVGEYDSPPRLVIHQFRITEGGVRYLDRVAGDFEAEFGPISVAINNLRTLPDNSAQQQVTIATAEGGTIEWSGNLSLFPLKANGNLGLNGQGLADFVRYSEHFLPFNYNTNHVDLELTYAIREDADGFSIAINDLQFSSQGSRFMPDGSDEPVFSTEAVHLSGGSLRIPENRLVLESLTVVGPHLRTALRADGTLSILDLVPASESAENSDSGDPFSIEINRIAVENGRVDLRDESLEPPVMHSVEQLMVEVLGLDNRDGTELSTTASLTLASGGTVNWEGNTVVLPQPQATGRLAVQSLALPVIQPYLGELLHVSLDSGTLDLNGDLEHGPGQLLALSGDLEVKDLAIQDNIRNEPLLGWRGLFIDRFEADLNGHSFNTSVLEFDQLYGRLHIDEEKTTNIADLFVKSGEPSEQESSQPAPSSLPEIVVGGVDLNEAALDFSDFSLPLPFAAAIKSLNGTITTLSTQSTEPAKVDLQGQVNEFGEARINGQITAPAFKEMTEIDMIFRNLEMDRLTPYTVQFAGYAIEDGRLDLDLKYALRQSELRGANDITIRNLTLGEKVEHPGAGSLPLALAVALLKDSEGVIDIDLPVEGNVDDPKFKIGGVVLKAIGNLISKAVTAPFRLLGNLIGIDSEDFGTLAFTAGDATLTPPDREQLEKLYQAMGQRPELSLEISGTSLADRDAPALAEQAVDALMEAREGELEGLDDVVTTDRQRAVLESLALERWPSETVDSLRADHLTPNPDDPEAEPVLDEAAYNSALRQRLINDQDIPQSALTQLATERAESVLSYLQGLSGEAPLRARVIAPGTPEQEVVEKFGENRVPLPLSVAAAETHQ